MYKIVNKEHSFKWHLTVLTPYAAIKIITGLIEFFSLGYLAPNWGLTFLFWANLRKDREND